MSQQQQPKKYVYIPESGFGLMCTDIHEAAELTRQGIKKALIDAGLLEEEMSDPKPPTTAEQNAAIEEAIRQAKETQERIRKTFEELTKRNQEPKS